MRLNEEIYQIRKLIFELSPQSSGVKEFIELVNSYPELLGHMNFERMKDLKDFLSDASYKDFEELRKEADFFIDRRKRYFKSEIDELERAVQDLTRNEGLEISVEKLINAFIKAKEITISDKVWNSLENTECNKIKKGEMSKVMTLAKKYNKQNPKELKKALISGDYKRPLIVKFGNRYHLVAGNTRLCTAAALGIKPQVLIAEI